MKITAGSELSHIQEEIIQIDLDHKFLLRAHRAFVQKDIGRFVILMDYCEQGSLAS